MKKSTVKALIAGAIIFSLGIIIVIVAFGLNGWNFELEWETKIYQCEEQITDIDLHFAAGKLTIESYDGDAVKLEYPHSTKYTAECKESGHKLTVTTINPKWYSSFGLFNKVPQAKLYIPRNQVVNMDVELNAGSLIISGGTYGVINAEVNYGEMNVDSVKCTSFCVNVDKGSLNVKSLLCDDIYAQVAMGDANIDVIGVLEYYTIQVDVSLGKTNIESRTGIFPSKKIRVNVSMGNINLTFKVDTHVEQ